jgi:cobaltochelatase CobT
MATSPIIVGLKKWLQPRCNSADVSDYRVFTTEFDEIVDVAQLSIILSKLSREQKRSFDDANEQFDTLFMAERVEIAASGATLVRELQSRCSADERARTVVSLLIDHSGSMRGLRMMAALLAVEGAVDALDHAGIATELLGYTTANWKGGRSRRAWQWAGKPSNPGRLCDLRHLVYGAADRRIRHPWQLRMALRPDMLHENVDGEALIWAADRLDPAKWTRRVICLVSDGAPVDDSTLLANDDQNLLARHLQETEQRVTAQGVTVGTLLIGGEAVPEPALFERAEEPQQAGIALMRLLRRALIDVDRADSTATLIKA